MADTPQIGVVDATSGQVSLKPTTDVSVTQIQGLTMLTTMPAEFDHLVRVPAANGMVKAAAVSHDALMADASKKANFTALATLSAHGRSNGATNSPTNSKTDYNTVTTLLGAVTDGLNQTNAAQNTIATNLNALATQFNALLTWLGTNQTAINNLRLAGAA